MPLLKKIKMATIGVSDLAAIKAQYKKWLHYNVIDEGRVPDKLAQSWGCQNSANKKYIMMQPQSGEEVFIRAVEITPVPNYRALTTWGWNAIEIIVENPATLFAKLCQSSFQILGKPAPLNNYPSIHAMQIQGSEQDVLYLTAETDSTKESLLPSPLSPTGRIFIMVLAGPDINILQDWYAATFQLDKRKINNSPVELINRAQGISLNSERPITTMRLEEHGNLIELDGYGKNTNKRPQTAGEIPPGIAITSMLVDNLDNINSPFIMEPTSAYGSRTATILGPVGELIELIEE